MLVAAGGFQLCFLVPGWVTNARHSKTATLDIPKWNNDQWHPMAIAKPMQFGILIICLKGY